MTWYEAYQKVCFKIWGNSTVPSGTATMLQGDEGIIANVARKIMQDYNYWFMQTYVTITTVAGTQAYRLPDDFKEPISAAWEIAGTDYTLTGDITLSSDTITNKASVANLASGMVVYHDDLPAGTTISTVGTTTVTLSDDATGTATGASILFSDGTDYFSNVLSPITTQDAQQYKWQTADTTEYPMSYEVMSDVLVLYPNTANSNRVLHLLYWQFLDRPVTADWVELTSTENDLLKFGADLVINLAASEMAEIIKEWDTAQYYEKRAGQAMELLKNEDRRRRQTMHHNIQYKEF
jgi:hypothetical protein